MNKKIKLNRYCYWEPIEESVYLAHSLISLSSKETRCLKLLINNMGKPLQDIDIFNYVWNEEYKEFQNKSVRSMISNIRKKLPCLNILNSYGGFYLLEKYREPTPDFQEYLLDFMDQAKNGITVTDPNQDDNPIIYINAAFTDTFGYYSEEVIGKNCRFLQNDDRDQTGIKEIKKSVENNKEVLAVLRNYHKSGKLIYNEVQISPIFDKETLEIKYFLGIQKDVTQMYALIDSLKKENTHNIGL